MRQKWPFLVWFSLAGCEPMADPGPPFEPVAVEPPAAPADPDAAPDEPDDGQPEVIPWEELQADNAAVMGSPPAAPPDAAAPPAAADPALPAGSDPALAAATPAPAAAPPAPAVPAAPAPPAVTPGLSPGGGWPVRLVKLLPETQPPRAILGLPDGQEIVVSPGAMVPDHGLVVISIGPAAAQLAQITPQGDHAAIQTVTLQPQY